MKQFILVAATAIIIALVAWWSFEEVPAEPMVLEQPPLQQHLDDSSGEAEVTEVFRSSFNVQGMVRTLVLNSDRTLTQHCDVLQFGGCVGSAGTTTVTVSNEDYQSVVNLLRSIEAGAANDPEPDVMSEAYFYTEHTVDGVTVTHAAPHPVVDEVEAILNQYLELSQ